MNKLHMLFMCIELFMTQYFYESTPCTKFYAVLFVSIPHTFKLWKKKTKLPLSIDSAQFQSLELFYKYKDFKNNFFKFKNIFIQI